MIQRCSYCGTLRGGLVPPPHVKLEPWPESDRCPQCVGKTERVDDADMGELGRVVQAKLTKLGTAFDVPDSELVD